MPQGGNTKQEILRQSIRLFGEFGYEAVSMRQIAAAVGIKGGSIYNHFESKEDILNHIISFFQETMEAYMPNVEDIQSLIDTEPPVRILQRFIIAFPQENLELMISLYRILFTEQYHNRKLQKFCRKMLIQIPEKRIEEALRLMMDRKLLPQNDAKALAVMWNRTFLIVAMEATHDKYKQREKYRYYVSHWEIGNFLLSLILDRRLEAHEKLPVPKGNGQKE